MMRSLRPLAVLLPLLLLAPDRAFAQSEGDKGTARELGMSGEVKLASRDYKGAENDFRRANALYHAPTLILGLARAQANQGKVVEAWENYHSIILENLTSPPAFANALTDAQKEIVLVEARRARVTITVKGADSPSVTVDDTPLKGETLGVARFINPGAHVFKATAQGRRPASQTLTIAEGSNPSVSLVLEGGTDALVAATLGPAQAPSGSPAPPASPDSSPSPTANPPATGGGGSWNKTAGYVAGGVGAAALIEGIVTGVIAVGKHSDLSKSCTNGCPPSESSALSSYHTVGALSTVGFVVGAIGLAGGAVLIFTAPKEPQASGMRVVPYIGFGSAGAVGTF